MSDETQTLDEALDELREFLVHAHSARVEWSHPTAFLVKIPNSTPTAWLVTVEDDGLVLRADDWDAAVEDVDEAIALIENELVPT